MDICRGGPLAHQQPWPAIGRLHTRPHSLTNPPTHRWRPTFDQLSTASQDTARTALHSSRSSVGPGRAGRHSESPLLTAGTAVAAVTAVTAVHAVTRITPTTAHRARRDDRDDRARRDPGRDPDHADQAGPCPPCRP